MGEIKRILKSVDAKVQKRVCVPEKISHPLSSSVQHFMPEQHRQFFRKQKVLYVAVHNTHTGARAGVLAGNLGMVSVPDEYTLCMNLDQVHNSSFDDSHFKAGDLIGVLAFEVHSRRRKRVNGRVVSNDGTILTMRIDQSFTNSAKQDQKHPSTVETGSEDCTPMIMSSGSLTP